MPQSIPPRPIRVRFAPSPTGYLHIGGARTAMYNYLFAKAKGGHYILRIEDTDTDRSERKFEEAQIEDLKWLGITHNEGPDVGGPFGPYRQSERLSIYKKYSEELISAKKAFYCFCTEEELSHKKEIAEREKLAPHYDGTCRHLSEAEIKEKFAQNKEAVIRFIVPKKDYEFHDQVRGKVVFPEGMIGDFVIMRANGIPVYNFAVVIDDMLMEISHVIRAEEHLPNTLRQLMIYESFHAEPPVFAHVSLLIGEDRQKLSKRHGATSVRLYKEQNYRPSAMLNYLLLLGWSHPDELDVFDIQTLGTMFDINRFTKSAAIYDLLKLNYINGEHLKRLSPEEFLKEVEKEFPSDHPFHQQTPQWKALCITTFRDTVNFFHEIPPQLSMLFDVHCEEKLPETGSQQNDVSEIEKNIKDYQEAKSWETTPKIKTFLKTEIQKIVTQKQEKSSTQLDLNRCFLTEEEFNTFSEKIKSELKIKGKQLFMGMRAVLTERAHGRDLKFIIPLTPIGILLKRLDDQ